MALAPQLFGLVSVASSAVGYGIYIKSILNHRTRPHVFSWMVWTLVLGIVFLAQLGNGAGAGAWASGSSAFACFLILLLALRRGEKNITASDWVAFAGALAIIPVWHFTQDALWAIVLATFIDALAYYPTFRKSYARPDEENPFLYAIDIFKWLVAFPAMGIYSVTTLLYPLFLIAANATLITMIFWRRAYLLQHPPHQRFFSSPFRLR